MTITDGYISPFYRITLLQDSHNQPHAEAFNPPHAVTTSKRFLHSFRTSFTSVISFLDVLVCLSPQKEDLIKVFFPGGRIHVFLISR